MKVGKGHRGVSHKLSGFSHAWPRIYAFHIIISVALQGSWARSLSVHSAFWFAGKLELMILSADAILTHQGRAAAREDRDGRLAASRNECWMALSLSNLTRQGRTAIAVLHTVWQYLEDESRSKRRYSAYWFRPSWHPQALPFNR
jgi:hypothetical protein